MRSGSTLDAAMRAGLPVLVVGAVMLVLIGVCVGFPCFSTGLRYGMWVQECPATDMRLDAEVAVRGVLRGSSEGILEVVPRARWADRLRFAGFEEGSALRRGYRVTVELRDEGGNPVEGVSLGRLKAAGSSRAAALTVPELPDGDYTLHVSIDAGFDKQEVVIDLPLFAPALVHLMSDRPIYKPGQSVLLRSVVLDRRDSTAIPERPGRWRIVDPNGNEVLVERDRGDAWGIADTSFPLASRAVVGTWRASFSSGNVTDEVSFEVRQFQLPRFSVDVTPSQRWFGVGDGLVVRGRAAFSSGAPVRDAPVEVTLVPTSGRWPLPIAWEGAHTARTEADGSFTVDYGAVPADLLERVELVAKARVVDDTGVALTGSARIVLSQEALRVQAVTEFGDGLAADFNNRVYLRVTSPDGRPLRSASVVVKKPYDPLDEGELVVTDADGVLAMQLDPGEPVTVVVPPAPVRVRPVKPSPPTIAIVQEADGTTVTLPDRQALDVLRPSIAACGQFVVGEEKVRVAMRLSRGGLVQRVMGPGGLLEDCVTQAMRQGRFGASARPRVVVVEWRVPDPRTPRLQLEHSVAAGQDVAGPLLEEAALRARRCLPADQGQHRSTVMTGQWHVEADSTRLNLEVQLIPDSEVGPRALACVRRQFLRLVLPKPAPAASMGQMVAKLVMPTGDAPATPMATTRTAYQLQVANVEGQQTRTGSVVLAPSSIPGVRLRATPALAGPGDEVVVEVFRGPDYYGDLPEKLRLRHGSVTLATEDLDGNQVTFQMPDDARGFLHVEWSGARTVIFVREPEPLTVAVSTDASTYRPGSLASLTVTTQAGAGPRAAAVGLVGVDQALADLAPLLGPSDYGRVTVRATSDQPAFGAFDPRALALGQISGENAAKAALLRVSEVPLDAAGDQVVNASASASVDTETELVAAFYRALEATLSIVGEWERTAPETEQLTAPRMVALYQQALEQLRTSGQPAVDAFGRELRLTLIPEDLLAQLEPRRVVVDATRLPEDVVSLERYVRTELSP